MWILSLLCLGKHVNNNTDLAYIYMYIYIKDCEKKHFLNGYCTYFRNTFFNTLMYWEVNQCPPEYHACSNTFSATHMRYLYLFNTHTHDCQEKMLSLYVCGMGINMCAFVFLYAFHAGDSTEPFEATDLSVNKHFDF